MFIFASCRYVILPEVIRILFSRIYLTEIKDFVVSCIISFSAGND